jgi:hypothetical protein
MEMHRKRQMVNLWFLELSLFLVYQEDVSGLYAHYGSSLAAWNAAWNAACLATCSAICLAPCLAAWNAAWNVIWIERYACQDLACR